MGLDGVELVMEFEDEFGIQIPDDAAEKMPTVGDVTEFVYAELRRTLPQAKSCLTSRSFYKLRQGLVKLLSVPRRDITPKTELEHLIPIEHRREIWRRLLSQGLRLPSLERSSVTVLTASLIVIVCAGGLSVMLHDSWFLLTTLPLWFVASLVTKPLAVFVPGNCRTISDLVMYCTSMNKSEITDAPSRRDILYKIKVITSEQLGIPIDKIAEDSNFSEDLGIG